MDRGLGVVVGVCYYGSPLVCHVPYPAQFVYAMDLARLGIRCWGAQLCALCGFTDRYVGLDRALGNRGHCLGRGLEKTEFGLDALSGYQSRCNRTADCFAPCLGW